MDCLVGSHAYEIKTGAVEMTASIESQIAKDATLLASKRVEKITWVFRKNLVSGYRSVSPEVLTALQKAGINVIR